MALQFLDCPRKSSERIRASKTYNVISRSEFGRWTIL